MYNHKTLNPPNPPPSGEQGAMNLFPGFINTENYMEKQSGDRTPHSQSGIIVTEQLTCCSSHLSLDDYKQNNNITGKSEKCFKESISRSFSKGNNLWKDSFPVPTLTSDIWRLPRYSIDEYEDVLTDPSLRCPLKDISFHESFYWSYDDDDIPGNIVNMTWADHDDEDDWSFWRLYDLCSYKDILEEAQLCPWLYKDLSGILVLADECTYTQYIDIRVHGPRTIYELYCNDNYDGDYVFVDSDTEFSHNLDPQHYYYAQVDEYPNIRELPDYLRNFFSKFF